ncbi:MAG: cytochrome bc1 complex cytochrome b subunit, partial [Actinomycetes bacterium]
MSDRDLVASEVGRLDDRLSTATFLRRNLNKVFPDHWSFMFGEIALYTFIILLLTGVYLSLFFDPSMQQTVYRGSYVPLDGLKMSQAYASTLNISFDVRGGLVIRQIHHWAALLFVAAICVHLLRVFFTGAFRRPREINWVIGVGLLGLALVEGFAGYSLPDDLLSGTGLRIAEGVMLSIPVVGTYLTFFIFNGQFPGTSLIPRLYMVHILLIPGLILGLITVHLMIVWYQKHTQYPGPGRTEKNVVGYPFMPVYMAKAGGFFFIVFGVVALLGGLVQINPIWLFGPYNPSEVSAGSQPDWYIGFLEGALRMFPNWSTRIAGHFIAWNVFIPAAVIPGLMFGVLVAYPFLEAWVTGDKREHHILDRPRNQPTRTGLGVMALVFYGILWFNGGNDVVATHFGLSLESITWACRVLIFVAPPIAYYVTKRVCLGLSHRDRDKVLHGRESGVIEQLPTGEFVEVHVPLSPEETWTLVAHEVQRPIEAPPSVDENGIPAPGHRLTALRARLSRFYFEDRVEPPTEDDLHKE